MIRLYSESMVAVITPSGAPVLFIQVASRVPAGSPDARPILPDIATLVLLMNVPRSVDQNSCGLLAES